MDKYAPFVWAAYGVSAMGLAGITTVVNLERRRLAVKLRGLEDTKPAPEETAIKEPARNEIAGDE